MAGKSERLDAIASAFALIAAGKSGTVRNGARVKVGKLTGNVRAAWWNWVYRARYNPDEARLYGATILGRMPLVVDKGITYLVLSGPEVAEVREAYRTN